MKTPKPLAEHKIILGPENERLVLEVDKTLRKWRTLNPQLQNLQFAGEALGLTEIDLWQFICLGLVERNSSLTDGRIAKETTLISPGILVNKCPNCESVIDSKWWTKPEKDNGENSKGA